MTAIADTYDFEAFVRRDAAGICRMEVLVDGVTCGNCVNRIERALNHAEGVVTARVNLAARRLALAWHDGETDAGSLSALVERLGYRVVPFAPERLSAEAGNHDQTLMRSLAVAGFAAANIMMLSVAVWAGNASDMGPGTRGMLVWISAVIAVPTVAYSGRTFFVSALAAIRAGRMNMDVPIALAISLTMAMSLYEAIIGGRHVYFDSAVTLLFFILAGRALDARARGRARSAAEHLMALQARAATVLDADGRPITLPVDQVRVGMRVLVAAGERAPVDGEILDGSGSLDASLISGESAPKAVGPGERIFAGMRALDAVFTIRVDAVGRDTLLAEIARLTSDAEQQRARYVELADRLARAYAPGVHLLAAATLIGWLLFSGIGWQGALLNAVAVLIVTCPCALALAVPVVQVVASGRLLRKGIIVKSPTALERLAAIDALVLDKTGTLTTGELRLRRKNMDWSEADLVAAASMAAGSRHPLARALVRAVPSAAAATGVQEIAGAGLSRKAKAGEIRLGSRAFCSVTESADDDGPELWLHQPGRAAVRFAFDDTMRSDAVRVIKKLAGAGIALELLSGDRPEVVRRFAEELGLGAWRGGASPADKAARLTALAKEGRRVGMVGDGLNDAPALATALVSLSPATAADISQCAADLVFQGSRLEPVAEAIAVARRTQRLVRQNLFLSFGYNLVMIPLAMAGALTPLIAAVAMSLSSLTVVVNALRLEHGELAP